MQRSRPLTRLARDLGGGGRPVVCPRAAWQRVPARHQSSQPPAQKAPFPAPATAETEPRPQRRPVIGRQVIVSDHWIRVPPSPQDDAGRVFSAPLAWLRDICECEHCVSPDSGQKRFATTDVPDQLEVANAALDGDGADPRQAGLRIEWKDDFLTGPGVHLSRYRPEQLFAARPPQLVPLRRPWDTAVLEERLVRLSYADWTAGGPAFWRALAGLYELGLVVLEDVPAVDAAVLDAARALGPVHNTFYGASWDVVSVPRAANVAYTSAFLGLHQDLLYMRDPPGVQLLHCLRNDAAGGASLFSDGLRAAWAVRLAPATAESLFSALSATHVPYAYARAGHAYRYRRPVVGLASGDAIKDIAWAPPFQDAFPPPVGETDTVTRARWRNLERWKKAARAFSDAAEAPPALWEVRLRPGQCVVFDNRRVLHGRREFDPAAGHRHLRGAYVAQQDVISRLQQLPADLPGVERVPLYGRRGVAFERNLVAAALGLHTGSSGKRGSS